MRFGRDWAVFVLYGTRFSHPSHQFPLSKTSQNDFLMQFQADILNIKISRPDSIETTALGVALLAGLSVKLWTSPDDFKSIIKINKLFVPSISSRNRSSLLSGWKETIAKTLTRKNK